MCIGMFLNMTTIMPMKGNEKQREYRLKWGYYSHYKNDKDTYTIRYHGDNDSNLITSAINDNDPIELDTVLKCAKLKMRDIKSLLHQNYYLSGKSLPESAYEQHREKAEELIKVLIKHGFDVNIKNQNGTTYLNEAMRHRNFKDVIFLIENLGAKLISDTVFGYTPLHFAVESDSIEKVTYLLDKGCSLDARSNEEYGYETPFHRAKSPKMVECLIKRGANIDVQDKNGDTLLHNANNLEMIECLINNKANPNLIGDRYKTPLQNQIRGKSFTCVQYLVEHGAAIDATDEAIQYRKDNKFPDYQGCYCDGQKNSFDITLRNANDTTIFRFLLSVGMHINSRYTIEDIETMRTNGTVSSEVGQLAIEALTWEHDNFWQEKYIDQHDNNDASTILNKLCFFWRSCVMNDKNDITTIGQFIKKYAKINEKFSWKEAAIHVAIYNKNCIYTHYFLSQLGISEEDCNTLYSIEKNNKKLKDLYTIAKEAKNKQFCRDIWTYVFISKCLRSTAGLSQDLVNMILAYREIEA